MPYVQCTECGLPPVDICLHCFARGVEMGHHHSNHKYKVIKNDFPVFGRVWMADEEVRLLEAIEECGIGNWLDIAKRVQTKNRHQCELHYNKYYLEDSVPPLPATVEADLNNYPAPIVFKQDPPRAPDGSTLQQEMAGYMAARGDFTVEHDNYAEMCLQTMEFSGDEDQLDFDFKIAVVDMYLNVLRERHRRKRIIRDYGLINIKKSPIYYRRYDRTIGANHIDALRVFGQLLPPVDWDLYLEGLHLEFALRQDIKRMQSYRKAGVKYLRLGQLYDCMNARRHCRKQQCHLLTDMLNNLQVDSAHQLWLHSPSVINTIARGLPAPLPNPARKTAPALDIVNLPGYDKLSDEERQLCSGVRLVPEAYLEFRRLLITECTRLSGLRLAQARPLIKIDVNKTRKIYDFLLGNALIYKPQT
ncbi:Transcriptional adapter 2-alpha [Lamellibrachia satsuma]|nr:Transcriptional adapter 2-alpha [Lamellibrachia satsuma]